MPDQPTPPRRRITDGERRRWNDHSLDLLKEDVDELKRFYALLSQVPGLMQGLQERMEEQGKDIRELRAENRQAHVRVERKTDEIKQTVAPTRWTRVKDFATIVSLLLVPILAAYVAARGGR